MNENNIVLIIFLQCGPNGRSVELVANNTTAPRIKMTMMTIPNISIPNPFSPLFSDMC
jgi:hypothetical protein